MTKVAIIKPEQKNMIPFRNGEHGKWYKIAKYDQNPFYVGEIGIYISADSLCAKYSWIVTPDGSSYSHPDFFIEELSEVTITVKE